MLRATAHRRSTPSPRDVKDLVHALVQNGKLDAAARLLAEHLQRDPSDPALWMQHAELSRKLGRFDRAVDSFRQTARLLRKAGHSARARAALTCAQTLAPRDPAVLADLQAVMAELMRPASPRPALVPVAPAPPLEDDPRPTRLERRRPQLALVGDAELPTDPYCPLFDWLDEA